MSKQYNRSVISAAMVNTQGRYFSVRFKKKDGSDRQMTARIGVKKYLVGGKNTTENYPQYITVFETVNPQGGGGYKNVNLDTVYEIKSSGATMIVDRSNEAA